MSPLDIACLPATARLDLLVRGLLRCRPSRRRRIIDDHRLCCKGRDRELWRGQRISQRAVADALTAGGEAAVMRLHGRVPVALAHIEAELLFALGRAVTRRRVHRTRLNP